jgi:hypothetical protein
LTIFYSISHQVVIFNDYFLLNSIIKKMISIVATLILFDFIIAIFRVLVMSIVSSLTIDFKIVKVDFMTHDFIINLIKHHMDISIIYNQKNLIITESLTIFLCKIFRISL